MSDTAAFPGKRLVLAAAIAAALPLSGCATVQDGASAATPIYPIQRHVGMVAQSATTGSYEQGRDHFRAGKYGLALDAFRAELAKHPRSVVALNGIGAVYDKLGRYDLAVSYYYRALQVDPDSARTLSNLGYSFLLQGRPDAARGVLEMATSLEPDNAVIARNLNMATERMAAAQPADNAIVAQEPARQPASQPQAEVPAVTADATAAEGQRMAAASVAHSNEAPAAAAEVVLAESVAQSASEQAVMFPEEQGVGGAVAVAEPAAEAARLSAPPAEKTAPPARVAERAAPVDAGQAVAAEAVVSRVAPAIAPTITSVREAAPAAAASPQPVAAAPATVAEPVVVVIDRVVPAAVRSISRQTGHAQLAFDTPEGSVEVSNGNGYEGMAGLLSRYYAGVGQQVAHVTNAAHFNHARTVIYYRAGKREVADALRARLPVPASLQEATGIRTDARVVLGKDIGFYQGAIRRMARGLGETGAQDTAGGHVGFAPSDARIEVSNGNGRRGMARLLGRVLGGMGETVTRITNADNFRYPTTQIYYAPGHEQEARALAAKLPVDAQIKPLIARHVRRNAGVRVIIGRDFLHYEHVMHGLLASTVSEERGA